MMAYKFGVISSSSGVDGLIQDATTQVSAAQVRYNNAVGNVVSYGYYDVTVNVTITVVWDSGSLLPDIGELLYVSHGGPISNGYYSINGVTVQERNTEYVVCVYNAIAYKPASSRIPNSSNYPFVK